MTTGFNVTYMMLTMTVSSLQVDKGNKGWNEQRATGRTDPPSLKPDTADPASLRIPAHGSHSPATMVHSSLDCHAPQLKFPFQQTLISPSSRNIVWCNADNTKHANGSYSVTLASVGTCEHGTAGKRETNGILGLWWDGCRVYKRECAF